MLTLLLKKFNYDNRMLQELTKNVLMTNLLKIAHVILIHVLESQIKQLMNALRQGS